MTPIQERGQFPTAGRCIRFIDSAFHSAESPLAQLRAFYRLALDETAGPWWKTTHNLGTRKITATRPLNPLGEMVRTYFPHLTGESIVPVCEPEGLGDRGSAKIMEYRLRQWCDDANYRHEDESVIMDAMLAVGVMYVYRNVGGQAIADENSTLDMGQPGVKRISIENMVVDPNAEDWDLASGIGHWYLADRSSMLEAGIADEELLNKLPNAWENLEELQGSTRDRKYTQDEYAHLQDTVLLWEFCFRHRGRRFCCTMPPIRGQEFFLIEPYEIPSDGPLAEPEGSRYVVTGLNRMPGSLIPVSPAMVMMDAHLAKSAVMAKLVHQIETCERQYVIKQGMQQTVMALKEGSPDGYVFGDPLNIKEMITGGMVKELAEGYALLESLGIQVGPNVQLAGGQDDPGKTATASSILAGNAAVVLGEWKRTIEDRRTMTLRRVAAMLLQGQDQQEFGIQLPTGDTIPIIWDASTLDMSYDQYRYRIRPSGGSTGMDARAKLRSLFEIAQVLPPFLQFFSGMMGADPQRVMRVVSDLSGMEELDEILPSADWQGIQMKIMGMLAQGGQAKPAGGGGQQPGVGGMGMGGQLQNAGPGSRVASLNSDNARAVPA